MTSLEVAIRLLAMETAIVLLAGVLGSGLASLVPGRVPGTARVALAPAFGLALGFPVLFAGSQLMTMSTGAFVVLLPLALISGGIAAVRSRHGRAGRGSPARASVAAFALALAVPLAILSTPLIEERSLGPVGYQISDAVTYATYADHLAEHRWIDEEFGLGKAEDRIVHQTLQSPIFQGTGPNPFAAAINELFGWSGLDSQSALTIALVAIGALGCFALLLIVTGSAWAGLTAALLYAGPVNYQLFIDGSEAALAGLALLGPLVVVASRAIAHPVAAGGLLGVLLGGMMTVYTAFVPILGLTLAIALAIGLTGGGGRTMLRRAVIAAGAATIAVAVVAALPLVKNVGYAKAVSDGQLERRADLANWDETVVFTQFGEREELPVLTELLPPFNPPAEAAPAWLTQARERYDLLPLEHLPELDAAVTVFAVPTLVLVLAAAGAWRFRVLGFLLIPVPLSIALAVYGFESQDCGYCGGRALLAIPPILVVLACAGLVAVGAWFAARTRVRAAGVGAAAAAAVVLIAIGLANDRALAERLADSGYLLREEAREVFDEASGQTLVEGAGAGHPYTSYFESTVLPAGLRNATGELPSVDPEGLAIYLYPEQFPPTIPDADYRFVFTRLGGVEGGRRVVVEDGPYALEERESALDVTIVNGVVADIAQRDPTGRAWVTGPMTLLLADAERLPATVRLELVGPAASSLRLEGLGTIVREGISATVCVPAPGRSAIRRVAVPLLFEEPTYEIAEEAHELPIPEHMLELRSLRAARACPGTP